MQSIQQVATAMTSAVDDVADQLEIQTRKAAEEGSHVTLLSDTTECELGRQLPSRFARRVKALSGPTFNVTFSAGAVFTIAAILTILPACLLRSDLLGLIGIIAACLAAVVMSTAAFAICIQKGWSKLMPLNTMRILKMDFYAKVPMSKLLEWIALEYGYDQIPNYKD